MARTVAADDVQDWNTDHPRNSCPLHLRITAMDMFGFDWRVRFLARGAIKESYRAAEKNANKDPRELIFWAEFDGRIVVDYTTNLAALIGCRPNSLCGVKSKYRKKDPNATEGFVGGIRVGWGEPPCKT